MKNRIGFSLLWLIFLLGMTIGYAEEKSKAPKPKYTAAEVYTFFDQYHPNDVVRYTYKAVEMIAKVAEKASKLSKAEEEELMAQQLKKFWELSTNFKYSEKGALYPFPVVARCDKGRVTAHPIKVFFPVMSQDGFISRYKDIKEKKVALLLCKKSKAFTPGVWETQYQWWPQTDRPLWMGMLMVQIPNSPYHIHSFYPTKKYGVSDNNPQKLNALLRQLGQ